jgi:hypothetical protein
MELVQYESKIILPLGQDYPVDGHQGH